MRNTHIFVVLLLVLLAAATITQADPGDDRLIAGEYFFDTDPGPGNGFPLVSDDGAFDEPFESVNQIITLPELTSGPHYFFIRLRNVDGTWGIPQRRLLLVTNTNTVAAAEYFYDNDPGGGNGTPVEVTSEGRVEASLDTNGLGQGLHTLNLRLQDAEGSWGPARKQTFEVTDWTGAGIISRAEYFIDTDPGEGNGIPLSAVDGYFNGAEEDLVGYLRTSTIGEGEHTLHIRALDTNGLWTMPAAARPFTVTQFLGKLGDLNGDDQVDLKDAILSLMVVNGQKPPTLRTDYVSSGVDVDNWQVGLPEAIYVLKKTAE